MTSTYSSIPRIKFCGITNAEDLSQAVACGVDALGFVFVKSSPRAIDINSEEDKNKVINLLQNTPAFISNVALVVNPNNQLCHYLQELPIDLIQFHGDESPVFCQQVARNKRWIKALQVKPNSNLKADIKTYVNEGACGILLDGYDPKQPNVKGGTGHSFDWEMFAQLASEIECPLILAGGLTVNNVASAIKTAKPFAVDVSGGIEARNQAGEPIKGKKDVYLMQQFVNSVKSINA